MDELCHIYLYIYVPMCYGFRIEGSYPIEWCIGEPMPVFYHIIQTIILISTITTT